MVSDEQTSGKNRENPYFRTSLLSEKHPKVSETLFVRWDLWAWTLKFFIKGLKQCHYQPERTRKPRFQRRVLIMPPPVNNNNSEQQIQVWAGREHPHRHNEAVTSFALCFFQPWLLAQSRHMTKLFLSFSSRYGNKINDVDGSQVTVKYVTVVIPGANVADIYTRKNRKHCLKKKKKLRPGGRFLSEALRIKSHSCEEGKVWGAPSCPGFFSCSRGANRGQALDNDFKKNQSHARSTSHKLS